MKIEPIKREHLCYSSRLDEDDQLDAEEWIAFHLFSESALAFEIYPTTATERLAQEILIEMEKRFMQPGTSFLAPHMIVLKKKIIDLLNKLDAEAVEHCPHEEDCNQVGRDIFYLVIAATRPDLLEPQRPAWLVNGAALGLGMAIAAILLFLVYIWPGWPTIAQALGRP